MICFWVLPIFFFFFDIISNIIEIFISYVLKKAHAHVRFSDNTSNERYVKVVVKPAICYRFAYQNHMTGNRSQKLIR